MGCDFCEHINVLIEFKFEVNGRGAVFRCCAVCAGVTDPDEGPRVTLEEMIYKIGERHTAVVDGK